MSLFNKLKLTEASAFLRGQDEKLARVIDEVGPLSPSLPEPPFEAFCKIIVNQQLSGTVADVILGRIRALPQLQNGLDAERFVTVPEDDLRACGISRNKANFLMGFAERVHANDTLIQQLSDASDADALNALLEVRGVGIWTAAIYLMSCHGRMDVYPHGDVTLNRAITLSHGFQAAEEKAQTANLVESWSPYRAVAARYLWKWFDAKDMSESS